MFTIRSGQTTSRILTTCFALLSLVSASFAAESGETVGGLPEIAAFYILNSVEQNDGKTPHSVTVNDVPVDAF